MKAILYAFLAAVFYAINIPASKVLLRDVGPTTMAALLYLGDVIKKGDVEIPLQGAFVVALEYVCPFDIERRQFVTHRFNSAKAKSRGRPRLSGSLPISSVSRIAFNVSGL